MNVEREKRLFRQSVLGIAAAGLLAGCHGIQTEGEKEARRDFQAARITRTPSARKAEKLLSDSNLSNVVAFALMNSPKVEAAYRDWEASIERITQSRSLPDPQLTFQMDIANIVTSIMPGLMMNLPGPGKLRAGADVASAQSQAKYFQFQTAVLESAFEVKQRYYQLLLQSEKIRVNQETLRLLTDLESLALTQNEVGKVTLQDVLRAQIEQEKLKNEIANLQDSRGLYVERFKAALGLTPADPAPPMPERFESTDFDVSADKLFDLALAKNTRLKAMESEVRAAEASIILASKARIPDASLGLMADVKMSPVFYRPLATVSLPVWRDKIKAQIAEAQAARRSAEARLSAEQIALAVDFLERKFLYREVNRNLELLDEQLLPRARRSLEVARSGYLAGQIDFLNLTDSERTLLAFELERVESGTQREIILAELSLIIEGMPPSGGAERMNTGIGPARTAGTGRVTGNMNSMR